MQDLVIQPNAQIPMPKKTETVIINFGADATDWFREISAAVLAGPEVIQVQFVGGCAPPPYEIISLRNALLEIPEEIHLVTTATCALPPFGCAAWLVGDERRIAKDAVVWIPKLPEPLLRKGNQGQSAQRLADLKTAEWNPAGETHGEDQDHEDADDDEPQMDSRRSRQKPDFLMGRARMEADLRILADVLNEWFPTWEFSGSFLRFDDLLAWNVVKPEWGFGGRSLRTRRRAPEEAEPSGMGKLCSMAPESPHPGKEPHIALPGAQESAAPPDRIENR